MRARPAAHGISPLTLLAVLVFRAAHRPGAHVLCAVQGAHVLAVQGVLGLDGRARLSLSPRP
eukprot:1795991-Alexandrium_andersonii.AAC.1